MAQRGLEPDVPPRHRLIGRADELAQIERACRAATQGRGSLVPIVGEAGIGKTRLCQEAAEQAAGRGLRTVVTRCWVEGGAPPLWPWQPAITELCGAATADLLAVGDGEEGDDREGARRGRHAVDPDRFARFVAITDDLAAACDDSPALLVIDDVQAADLGTLLLTRFVARALPRLRLVLALGRRTGAPEGVAASDEADRTRLLDEIEQDAAMPLVLRRFDLAETTGFLDAHGFDVGDPDLTEAIFRVTSGNPLFLRRVVALGPPSAAGALPGGLRAAVEAAVDGLPAPARRVLAASAVLGQTPRLADAAALVGGTPAEVITAVSQATEAGLTGPVGRVPNRSDEATDRFAFTHEAVRTVCEDRLTPAERLDAHAVAAALLVADPTSDGRAVRASHLLHAAPRSADDAGRAVDGCRSAARAMVAAFAYEQADALLSAAVELHVPAVLGPAPDVLLVEWAEAALLCGRLAEARRRFDRAGEAAEHGGDPKVFAEAALGMGGVWIDERRSPVERARVLALQREARDRLPPDEVALSARLDVRLAAEAVRDGAPLGPVLEALARARESGDPRARAEALSLTHHTVLSAEHAHTRLGLADELVRVASEAGLGVLALMGLCWRAVDLFLLGDARAARALEDLRQRADALASENVLYVVAALDVMMLIRDGRLDEAEEAAAACHARGVAVGDVDALGYLGAHMLAIRWIQGREAELVDMAADVAASPTLTQAEFGFRAAAALFAARAGRIDQAGAALDALAADGLAALPPSSTWLAGMAIVAEAAAELGDIAVAGQAYDQLRPYADLPVMPSLAVACLGSTHRALGVAADATGDLDTAIVHFEEAVAADRRWGNRPLVAITRADLAQALARRGAPDDVSRAGTLLQQAIDEAAALGLDRRVEQWRAVRAGIVLRQGVIRHEGAGWLIGIDDRRVRVGDLVGMRYLAELLTHPRLPIPALSLVAGQGAAGGGPGPHELLDETARADYERRARELADELAEAEAHHDLDRATRLRVELEALVDHLEEATGLGGRSRTFADPAERARTAVRKSITRAVDQIEAIAPEIAYHLRSTVTTGATCSYDDDPAASVRWSTGP